MKKLQFIFLIVLVLVISLFSSCIFGPYYTISYMVGDTLIYQSEIGFKKYAGLPLKYNKDNLNIIFLGWFFDKDFTQPATMQEIYSLEKDTIIYAKYVQDDDPHFTYEADDDSFTNFTVSIKTSGTKEHLDIPANFHGKEITDIVAKTVVDQNVYDELKTVTIPENSSIRYIGSDAFSETGLTHIDIPGSIRIIGAAFSETNLTHVDIPEGVEKLYDSFYNCPNLESISISSSVKEFFFHIAIGCPKLKSITIDPESPYFKNGEDGNVYSKDGTEFVMYVPKANETSFTINDSVTSIAYSAFQGFTSLTNIVLGNNVETIGWHAFAFNPSLKTINLPSSLKTIEASAFRECSSLNNITLPNGLSEIDGHAFEGCTSLDAIVLPRSLSDIGRYTFNGCTSLTEVFIPNTVEDVETGAFYNCPNITVTVEYKDNSIENYPYYYWNYWDDDWSEGLRDDQIIWESE